MKDSELLHAWATRHDHDSFGELVRRHVNLVHASARRQVGDPGLAEEVTQAVFLVLARKAGSLGDRVVLSGWLFRTTRFVATRALRTRQRRTHHETLAAMTPSHPEPPATPESWKDVEPLLDAALAALPGADRDAVLLRYFEGRPLRAIGEQFGIGEEAAKKRVSRAVERLRCWLARRGVAITAGGLAALLTDMPCEAASAGLAGRISVAASGNTAGTSTLALATQAMRDALMARFHPFLPWAVAVAIIGMGTWLGTTRTSTAGSSTVAVAGGSTEAAGAPAVAQVPEPDAALPARPGQSKILLSVRSARDNQPLAARVLASLSGQREDLETRDYQTDVGGILEVPVSDPRIRSLVLFISAPGHVPVRVTWRHHEFVDPVLLHQTVLQPGQVLEGVVQDEEGRPIPDAQVRFQGSGMDWTAREYTAFHPRLSGVTSDAHGRFRTDQIPPMRGQQAVMSYVIEHPDFAKSRVWMPGPASLETNHVVVLQRGTSFTGRVVGPEDVPVAGARLVEQDPYGGLGREAVTGPDGLFAFGPFAGARVEVEITADGFQLAKEALVPALRAAEVVVRLQPADGSKTPWEQTMDQAPTVRLVGSVVDAESGAPIPIFRVRLAEGDGVTRSVIGDGRNGRFDWPVEMAFIREFALEVDADGHAAALSDIRQASPGTQTFDFRLERGGSVRGVVRDAEGRPVAGAVVGFNGPGFSFLVRDNQTFSGTEAPYVVTDANGCFASRLRLGTESMVIVHEAGFAHLPIAQIPRDGIFLAPWGAIEGVLLVGCRPAAGQQVMLRAWLAESDATPPSVELDTLATTDAQGRFRFDHAPPGPVALSRYFKFSSGKTGLAGIGPRQRVEVPPGGIVEVTLATRGRAVMGRLALSRQIPGHQWRDDLQRLVELRPDLPPVTVGAPHGNPEFWRQMRAHDRREAQIRKFFPDVQPDGSFRMEDVPPGSYVFQLGVSRPPTDPDDEDQRFFRPPLGNLSVPVEVTEGEDPLDLGTLTIPVKVP